ncbi:MAG: hypothetical protein LKM39_13525 [Chiayiivirga sp.]|nr:hypothetical protein [Chiayiivirga sp.]
MFGVGAIVAMQAVGEGSKREALRLVQSLGLNNLIVEAEVKPHAEATLKEQRAAQPRAEPEPMRAPRWK